MIKPFYELTSAAWWKASSIRALRTAIAALIPMLLGTTLLEVDWALAGSAVGLAVVLSYITSLAGLKELTSNGVSRAQAVTVRAVKQFAQTLAGFIGAAALLQEVDWKTGVVLALTSAVVTALRGAITELPEEKTDLTTTA